MGGLPLDVGRAPPPVFEARLIVPAPARPSLAVTPPETPPPVAAAAEKRGPAPVPVTPIEPPPLPGAAALEPATAPDQPPVPASSPSIATPPASPPNPATEPPPAPPPAPAGAPLNVLPSRLDLRFDVRYGMAAGEQTLVWVNEGERYTLTSVTAATGLAGVFYRGRFVQTSRGRITPAGLQPEEFRDQRGDRRSSARFDAGAAVFTSARGETRQFAYPPGMQDALSLFFQLALTAPPAGPMPMAVFNGKKVRVYVFEPRGEEMLETALGPLRTLHLARTTDADGRFEAWLAIDRHYLPVRVARSDEDGNTVELSIRSFAP